VLSDLHQSINAMIQDALGPGQVTVAFGPPAGPVDPPDAPIVNLWLSDIREEKTGRGSDRLPTRGEDGGVTGWRQPFRRYRLSYLMTVFAPSYGLEIEVIGELLRSLGGTDGLPESCRRGWLAGEAEPVRVDLACPDHSVADGWGLWSALGLEARTGIFLVITVAVRSDQVEPAALPVTGRQLSVDGQFSAGAASEVIEPMRRDQALLARARGTVQEG
jgi:Pvc16 N-terminal domain